MSDRIRPFYCGTQKADWACRNCYQCKKGYDDDKMEWNCDLELAIDTAFMEDGTVSAETAKRMGYTDKSLLWDCPEKVRI